MRRTISHFVCTQCREPIRLGACGKHRKKTGHKEFTPVYGDSRPGEKNA